MKNLHCILMLSLASATAAGCKAGEPDENLSSITLPPGFRISIYAENLEEPRQIAIGDQGTVFAGSGAGKVYAMEDKNSDFIADGIYVIDRGLDLPTGVEFKSGSLYVGALDRILRYDNIEAMIDQPPEANIIKAGLPDKTHHGSRYLRFGPDGFLYVSIGAPCNVCVEDGFAQIRRMRADGSGEEVYASGVRNSVGMAFSPTAGHLWFTDNGRDLIADDLPADELNEVTQPGQDFGFPYCHQGDLLDAEFGQGKSCADYVPPAVKLGAHVAALGLAFYTGSMFPPGYTGALIIARHGSWNRSEKVGYDLAIVRFDDDGRPLEPEVFASGWLRDGKQWGRPADVMQLADGSLLVSDDMANVIYRIAYAAGSRQ
jgi:glucose/arabinose dehydrogenase